MSQPHASLIIGPVLIAGSLNTFLLGICAVQYCAYLASGRKDPICIRLLVYWVIILDLYHSAATIYLMWDYAVINFKNTEMLRLAPWPLAQIPVTTILTSCPVQWFLTYRIKLFSDSNVAFCILIFLSLAQGTAGLVFGVLALLEHTINTWANYIPAVGVWMSMAIACDLGTTVCLVYYLHQSKPAMKRTSEVVRRMTRAAIESTIFGTAFCILELITFALLQQTNIYLIFALPMGRIYTINLLSTLNRRISLNQSLPGADGSTNALATGFFSRSSRRGLRTEVEEPVAQEEVLNFSRQPQSTRSSESESKTDSCHTDLRFVTEPDNCRISLALV